MNPLLSPPAPSTGLEQSPEQEPHGAAEPAGHGSAEPAGQAGASAQGNGALTPPAPTPDGQTPLPAPHSVCAHCGSPLEEGQHWCLHCGAATPGSLEERPNWRPLVAMALAATLLLAGAAVATAAALSKDNSAPRHLALVSAPTTAITPTVTTPPTTVPPVGSGGTGAQKAGKGSNLLFPPTT
ncbi:MAG TPA: hypothetical protein VNY52_05885, partial [Solirubrobacteraceae bacterium]|nr:hypothetical protein [Solirubrobacteraceae bacterium]